MSKPLDLSNLELVSDTRQEVVYKCPTCEKNKLYVNTQTNCWFCFVCGEGGRVKGDYEQSSCADLPSEEQPPFNKPLEHDLYQIASFLLPRVVPSPAHTGERPAKWIAEEVRRAGILKGGAIPLSNKLGRTIGEHRYDHSSPTLRYITKGQRGVWTINANSEYLRDHFIFEGLWDCINFRRLLGERPDASCHFLAGNQITIEQASILRSRIGFVSTAYLCFDNDKVAPFIKAQAMLKSVGIDTHFFPTPEGYKDWDEAIMKDWATCSIYLRELLAS